MSFYREPVCAESGQNNKTTEHGLGAAYREGNPLGYDGIARNSDRVSADHFLPALDKVCFREEQTN